jgi:hypothetical protein
VFRLTELVLTHHLDSHSLESNGLTGISGPERFLAGVIDSVGEDSDPSSQLYSTGTMMATVVVLIEDWLSAPGCVPVLNGVGLGLDLAGGWVATLGPALDDQLEYTQMCTDIALREIPFVSLACS